MTRTEIRRRALRAAAAVTFGVAMLGCNGSVVDEASGDEPAVTDGAHDAAHATAHHHAATSSAETSVTSTSASGGEGGQGGSVVASGGGGAGGGGEDCTPLRTAEDWDAYSACCNANGWDWNKGCEAWGPPMPPAMDWSAASDVRAVA